MFTGALHPLFKNTGQKTKRDKSCSNQLSYIPNFFLVEMAGLEPATRALKVRSNPSLRHLFYFNPHPAPLQRRGEKKN